MTPITARRAASLTAATVAVTAAALAGPAAAGAAEEPPEAPTASAAAAKPVIASPRQVAALRRLPVRIAVRAGAEHGDLVATLNGVSIGPEFARTRPGLRTLRISSSHGLRHGRNVLRVKARTGASVRRATVRFSVVHRRPLAGAGRARRTVVGRSVRLAGRLLNHPRGRRARAVRWTVVSVPRGSRLAESTPARGRPTAARPAGLTGARTLTPSFRPDRPGRYVLKMTAGSGTIRSSATVAIDASPRSAVIPIDTAIDGGDPAGATSDATPDRRPGIRVGSVVYRAPWLNVTDGRGTYSGRNGTIDYRSIWQIVVLHRRTLGLAWSRTYGYCTTPGAGGMRDFPCRAGADGRVTNVDMPKELSQIGNDYLVIASSHPRGVGDQSAGRWWDPPQNPGRPNLLTAVGFPAGSGDQDPLAGVIQGGAAMVGAGQLKPGEARTDLTGDGRARMRGFLIADVNGHYGYVSSRREAFDTRSESTCSGGSCTYAMTVAGTRTSAVQAASDAGFLIAVHDDRTLARRDAIVAHTGDSTPDVAAGALASFIAQHRGPGGIFVLSSFGAPLPQAGRLNRWAGKQLADAIASIGGSRHRFNLALSTPGSGYSLIGRSGADEGDGVEALGANARLRGALAPDADSRMQPANVSADGPPAERLQRLLIGTQSSSWPLDDQPGPRAALTWIGNQVPQLGGDPRLAYWQQTRSTIAAAERAVGKLEAPSAQGFTAADFATAKRRLLLELDWVQGTRDYLELLARPAGDSGATVWEEATRIQNRLEVELRIGQEQAEQSVEAFWFGVVRSMLSLAGGAGEWLHIGERFMALVEVAAAAVEASETTFETLHDGGEAEEIDENPRVRADELAGRLEQQAQQNVDGFWRLGNAIVSDPKKLQEVGTWAGCLPTAGSGGCGEGYEEYAVTPDATRQATRSARISLEQTLYRQLAPLTFPVWDTGLSAVGGADAFSCWLDSTNDPFVSAPRKAWTMALEQVSSDPAEPTLSRVSIMLARSGTTYIYPSEEMLERMFGEIDPDSDRSKLGMSPQEFMRSAERRFEPGASCSWER